ncbi:MAG: substrate-binding domain-containing protein [Chloroflexota bacterium]|nr:substrate-binding domain-containing protein [Chloroflexota bacterium]
MTARGRALTVTAIAALVLAACGPGTGGGTAGSPGGSPPAGSPGESAGVPGASAGSPAASDGGGAAAGCDFSAQTVGPNGEPSTPADSVGLTDAEANQIKGKSLKMAMLWAGAGPWYNALSAGASDEAKRLGIAVVATTEANFDPAKQATDVETAMAPNPDIVLTLVVDPTSGAQAFRPVVNAGKALVFVDNGADGYHAGREYVSVVTGDHLGLGRSAADLMNQALGGQGSIGYIFHDATFYVTNNRDREFRRTIQCKYPGIKIAAQQGFAEEGKTEAIASAMLTQHPEIKGIYVAWDTAAEGVVAAIRAAGREDVKVVTIDLGANNDLDMAQGKTVFGKVADRPYEEGQKMVDLAAYKILGKQAPPFVTVPTVVATKEKLVEAYKQSFNSDPPADVKKALGA